MKLQAAILLLMVACKTQENAAPPAKADNAPGAAQAPGNVARNGADGTAVGAKVIAGEKTVANRSGEMIKGSGVIKKETRTVASFTGVVTSGSFEVSWTSGEQVAVEVSADDNLLPVIRTTVEGDNLVIASEGSFSSNNPIKITLVSPTLTRIKKSGSGNFVATNVKDAENFTIESSGSGTSSVTGTAKQLKATLSGSGKLNASDLATTRADVAISGSGVAAVRSSNAVDAKVQGSGNIEIHGNPPDVKKDVSGSGSISIK